MEDKKIKKNRQYNEATLRTAIENVLQSNMTVYRASKEFNIPWTTLKENVGRAKVDREKGLRQFTISKIGRPFSLTVSLEQDLVSYIIEMQELGFGLTVNQIRQIAFSLAHTKNPNHSFNSKKGCAGWNWWVNFKNRYGLSLRTPENLSAGRASCSNPTIMADFYEKLETTLVEHDLMESPEKIWNCDETGLMYVNKPTKIVTKIGKQYVYNRTYAEKGTTTTVLACINAAGCFIPPLVIFKGVRNIPELSNNCLPNSMTRVSTKGWINADLFLEWLKFFNDSIPPARPVLLIMDSHASHVSPKVLEFARSKQIVLFTMPAHTSHILQPLDVGVFRPLKVAWRAELQKYKTEHPSSIPTRFNFHKFLTPAYEKSFTLANIRAGFLKSGIYPLNNKAICSEAITPSRLTDKPLYTTEQLPLQEIIVEEDFDEIIPYSEINVPNHDPLNDIIAQKSGVAPNTNEIFKSDIPRTQIDACPRSLEVDSELSHTIICTSVSSENEINQGIISNILNSTTKEKSGIQVHDILVLPKWTPKTARRSKRTVSKAACLTRITALNLKLDIPQKITPSSSLPVPSTSKAANSQDLSSNQKQKQR